MTNYQTSNFIDFKRYCNELSFQPSQKLPEFNNQSFNNKFDYEQD